MRAQNANWNKFTIWVVLHYILLLIECADRLNLGFSKDPQAWQFSCKSFWIIIVQGDTYLHKESPYIVYIHKTSRSSRRRVLCSLPLVCELPIISRVITPQKKMRNRLPRTEVSSNTEYSNKYKTSIKLWGMGLKGLTTTLQDPQKRQESMMDSCGCLS